MSKKDSNKPSQRNYSEKPNNPSKNNEGIGRKNNDGNIKRGFDFESKPTPPKTGGKKSKGE
jgi:hypothetical protein